MSWSLSEMSGDEFIFGADPRLVERIYAAAVDLRNLAEDSPSSYRLRGELGEIVAALRALTAERPSVSLDATADALQMAQHLLYVVSTGCTTRLFGPSSDSACAVDAVAKGAVVAIVAIGRALARWFSPYRDPFDDPDVDDEDAAVLSEVSE